MSLFVKAIMAESYVKLFIRAQKFVQRYRLRNVFSVGELLSEYLEIASRTNSSLPFLAPELTERIAAELEETDVMNLAELYHDELIRKGNTAQLESDVKSLAIVVLHGEILRWLEEYGADYRLWQLEFTQKIMERGESLQATLVYDNPDGWDEDHITENFQVPTLGPVDNVIGRFIDTWINITNDKFDELSADYAQRVRVLDENRQIPEDDGEKEADYLRERSRGTLFLNGVEFKDMRFG